MPLALGWGEAFVCNVGLNRATPNKNSGGMGQGDVAWRDVRWCGVRWGEVRRGEISSGGCGIYLPAAFVVVTASFVGVPNVGIIFHIRQF